MSETTTREDTTGPGRATSPTRAGGRLGAWFEAAATMGRLRPDPLAIDAVERAMLGVDVEPKRIGRYEVVCPVGSGGMGVVVRAFDPVLERDVAIKLVRHTSSLSSATARLRREAAALAQLAHPNVVPVYDVTEAEGRLCVVMKFVEGSDLSQWLRERPRDGETILKVFAGAGRGLAAAHAAGIVHRDVKPTNIMVETSGVPQVADFGLARLAAVEAVEAVDTVDTETELGPMTAVPTSLTLTGEVMGTPAYMSPEQLLGRPITPASDQFSFCVALYEALTGQRPFPGRDVAEISRATATVDRNRLLRARGLVPRSVIRAIVRGMAREPDERWPTMDALLHHLRPPTHSRRAWAIVGSVALSSLVALWAHTASSDACAGLELSWSPDRWTGGIDSDVRTVAGSLPDLDDELRSYASRWTDERDRVCRAMDDRSGAVPVFSTRCLELAASEFDQTLRVLAHDPGWSAREGPMLVASLPDPASCSGDVAPSTTPPHPAEHDLARAVVALRADDVDAARELVRRALQRSGASVHPRVATEAMLIRARISQAEGHDTQGVRLLQASYDRAVAEGLDEVAARAANLLAYYQAVADRPGDDAESWLRHAEAAIERGELPDRYRAMVLTTAGLVHTHTGALEQARDELDEAIVLTAALHGSSAPPVADALVNRSEVAARLGDHAGGVEAARRAHEIRTERFGAGHPMTRRALDVLAVRLAQAGQPDEASRRLEELLASDALDERFEVEVLAHLGSAQWMADRPEQALATYQRALDELGEIDPDRGMLWARLSNNIGAALLELERYDQAVLALERAADAYIDNLGAGHPLVSRQLWNVGWAQRQARRPHDARRTFERALMLADSPRAELADFEEALAQWEAEDAETLSDAGAEFAVSRGSR